MDGIVQLCHDEDWGTVCANGWDDSDASVVCRQLGFSPRGDSDCLGPFSQSLCMFVWASVYVCVNVCMSVCMCVRAYVYACLCVRVCMCIRECVSAFRS